METRKCPACGEELTADAKFCTKCGRRIVPMVGQKTVAPAAPPKNNAADDEVRKMLNDDRKRLYIKIVVFIAVVALFALVRSCVKEAHAKKERQQRIEYYMDNFQY